MTPSKCKKIFDRLARQNPHPTTELRYSSTFELLIAVMLSAQATDISVNKATAQLFKKANTPRALLDLGARGLRRQIRTIGLYNTKADHILETCRLLLEYHGGEVPEDRSALEKLPGVGRKTANVILNTAFGRSTVAVDTHIFRVANRTGLALGDTVRQVEEGLLKMIPGKFLRHAHHWLILHGRYTCRARMPGCSSCLIQDLCEWEHKGTSKGG